MLSALKKRKEVFILNKVKRGEIYYAKFPSGVGSEQRGLRPVIIIQNDKGNEYSPTTIVATITSRLHTNIPTHVYLDTDCLAFNSVAMLEQIRTIDKLRLTQPIGCVTKENMKSIDKAIRISLNI